MSDPQNPARPVPHMPQQLTPQQPRPAQQQPQQQQHSHRPGMMPSGGAARPTLRPAAAPLQPHAAPAAPGHNGPARIAAMPTMAVPARKDDSIALDDGDDAVVLHSKIKAFGTEAARAQHKWTRVPVSTGQGPVRIKTFHAKLSDQGLEYLDEAINHFIDEHPEVDIKFIQSNVGMFDGKFKDLALIVNVWY